MATTEEMQADYDLLEAKKERIRKLREEHNLKRGKSTLRQIGFGHNEAGCDPCLLQRAKEQKLSAFIVENEDGKVMYMALKDNKLVPLEEIM